jgi:hypothetical protein
MSRPLAPIVLLSALKLQMGIEGMGQKAGKLEWPELTLAEELKLGSW